MCLRPRSVGLGYDDMAINPNGQPVHPSAYNKATLAERTLAAWNAMPRKAFIAAWISTGYFGREHFPEGLGMSFEEAQVVLDSTGLRKSLGIPDDHAGQTMESNRPRFLQERYPGFCRIAFWLDEMGIECLLHGPTQV